MPPTPVVILGAEALGGAYLLRIRLRRGVRLRFGRFQGGRPISLTAGEYVYVGSALARPGSAALARRLLRHATRAGGGSHPVRPVLLQVLRDTGLAPGAMRPPATKRLHWHVDYLLEHRAAALIGVVALRTSTAREDDLAALLAAEPRTRMVARGLGASDAAGQTHLFGVPADAAWWTGLVGRIAAALVPDAADLCPARLPVHGCRGILGP
ncbi:MAG: GIY-YIG nuclease family protein [Candidatus Latescibacterota bacterium]|jgi:Uri superfamily endonuclease